MATDQGAQVTVEGAHDAHDPTEVAARLRLGVTRLARRLRQEAGAGLSPSLLSALATVGHHGPMTLGSLAEHERVAPPSITKVVAKLEAEGLVVRQSDPLDRRFARVTATPDGEALLAESRRRKTTWLAAQIDHLGSDDRARLESALDVLDRLAGQERA